ncbi:MAG: hypothetical protein KF914_18565 [Rhizobiaceae bacterium]|nr:hypothetical protein [Rhizobiaceae bacterium]
MELNMLEKDAVAKLIEAEYRNRGDRRGWRLLYCPWDLTANAKAAFIGLNPGGDEGKADHGEIDTAGSAYKIEDWSTSRRKFLPDQSPLQLQVRRLFTGLGLESEEVLAGNLVPFRSPDWKSLNQRPAAIRFGMDLWERILSTATPEIIVVIGKQTWEAFLSRGHVRDAKAHSVNWKNYVVRRGLIKNTKIVGLPHLSRFPIIGRTANDEAIDWAFGPEFDANLARGLKARATQA